LLSAFSGLNKLLVVCQIGTNISEELVASIFSVEETPHS
jgi:hypothetical protein